MDDDKCIIGLLGGVVDDVKIDQLLNLDVVDF